MTEEDKDNEDEVSPLEPHLQEGIKKLESYATKKTATQGLFNVALITKDAKHIKDILTGDDKQSDQQAAQLVLVVISLIIEVTAGFLMFYLARKSVNEPAEKRKKWDSAEKINDAVAGLAMLQVLVGIALSVT